MKLTNNFSLSEFLESRFFDDKQQEKVNLEFQNNKTTLLPKVQELANNLQVLRDNLGSAISINIAYRPKWYELSKGRSGNSRHCLCEAADIKVQGFTTAQVRAKIEKLILSSEMIQGGIGKYNSFVHYDIRGIKARW
jgi:uncharacterized protein YcbK (DUF882 family)